MREYKPHSRQAEPSDLAKKRIALGITQDAFADKLGISRKTYIMIEQKKTPIENLKGWMLLDIAKEAGYPSVDGLFMSMR